MPFNYGYAVTDLPAPSPFATPGTTPFITGAFLEGCDLGFQDQLYFLGILERSYPADYVASMRAKPGGGFELFQAAAKVGERLSIAVNRLDCCAFVITAEGGVKATGTIEFFRDPDNATNSSLTIVAGSVVRTSFGRDFITTEDAVFTFMEIGGPDFGPHEVDIIAVDVGWEYNVPGQVIAANGEVLVGEIDDVKCLIISPNFKAALSSEILVRNIIPTVNGQAACLDGLAADLDITRTLLETDEVFRVRIKASQDTVSPAAICRGVDSIFRSFDPTLSCTLLEVGYPSLPGIFYDAGSSADSPQVPANNFAWDMDPALRAQDRFKVWLSTVEMRGFFLIGLPPVENPVDFGMAYDGSDADTFSLQNAYDDTTTPDNGDTAYDGFPVFSGALNISIADMIEEKHAGGVGFDFFLDVPIPPPPPS